MHTPKSTKTPVRQLVQLEAKILQVRQLGAQGKQALLPLLKRPSGHRDRQILPSEVGHTMPGQVKVQVPR